MSATDRLAALRRRKEAAFRWLNATQFLGAFNDNLFKGFVTMFLILLIPAWKGFLLGGATILFAIPFLCFTAYAQIEGYIHDQYALDEKDGNLRVATTSSKNGHDVNNLFVLDENLGVLGSVNGFALNESIKAVRYIGDTAYVITYERTDPPVRDRPEYPDRPQDHG